MWHVYKHSLKGFEIVKDGFNLWALLFGVLYLFYKRLWKHGLLLALCFLSLSILAEVAIPDRYNAELAVSIIQLGGSIFMAIYVNEWRKEYLIKSGYQLVGSYNSKEKARQAIKDLQSS
ncbi:DUF2628 domain-containing protein [Thermodesulfatator atlanticus]|uniref:DUF2628 domain-containing protein n=1 Tax=Thermodesulfatator atlanticus TaxID=501497 RepID=UPI0003B4A641|nr:DUF2628 domain-containing protein [Thermodesulfatator atlanticus]